jgi:hypothetical protein
VPVRDQPPAGADAGGMGTNWRATAVRRKLLEMVDWRLR